MVVNVNDSNFAEGIARCDVALVDFWAPWCGPCRTLSPVIEELSSQYEGKVAFLKCNVDDCEEITDKFGIRGIPALIYFKNGVEVTRSTGVVPKSGIVDTLEGIL